MDIKRVLSALDSLGRSFRASSLGASRLAQRDRSRDRPVGQALCNPNDPVQAEHILAAKCKRERRASVAQRNYNRCIAGGV